MPAAKGIQDDKGRSILIAGPPFRGYLDMIAHGFEKAGARPTVLKWDYPARSTWQEAMFYSSQRYRNKLADEQDKENSVSLEKTVAENPPDAVVVMKAVEITKAAKKMCADRGIKLVLWAYDSATHFPIISRVAPSYDLVYTYEPADVEILSSNCKPAFLPMAYDPRHYFQVPDAKDRPMDLCFVGAIDPYPQRRNLIREIAAKFKNSKISVWSDSIHWYSHRQVRDVLFKGLRKNIRLTRKTLDHAEINRIYNMSKVCLNVHHVQSKRAVNPRTFEILGSGGLLLTDRDLGDIKGFEGGRGCVNYSSPEEVMRKIGELLSDEQSRSQIAAEGHARVAEHTFEQRARRILSDLH